jgi:ribosomal protein L11 methylase PrmA
MDGATAKQFLISKVIEEAGIEDVELSDIEKKMLQFTEVNSPPPDIYKVAEQFDREYDSDQYEAKIAALLRNARNCDAKNSAIAEQQWKDALESLKEEDHYILVMCAEAFGQDSALGSQHQGRKYLIYAAVFIGIVLIWLIKHVLN